jgi:hypothetical protein
VNEIYKDLDFQAEHNFYDRIELATIWGLRLDSQTSPFDLIKPGCELVNERSDKVCNTDNTDKWNENYSATEGACFMSTLNAYL